jgi:hypothetical protein
MVQTVVEKCCTFRRMGTGACTLRQAVDSDFTTFDIVHPIGTPCPIAVDDTQAPIQINAFITKLKHAAPDRSAQGANRLWADASNVDVGFQSKT